jgi:glycosyltransferase involved in cell wall biosynthesis
MRLLYVSTQYPNCYDLTRAVFKCYHLQAVRRLGHEVEVIAPVTTYPGEALLKRLPPRYELLDGMPVYHPRFHRTPVLWRQWHDAQYRWCVARTVRERVAAFRPDGILVAFLFPDGAAMRPVLQSLGIPHAYMALGSDFRIKLHQPRVGPRVRRVLDDAPAIFAPGRAMARDMAAAGVPAERIRSFYNGIDDTVFGCRRQAKGERRVVVYVGNFLPVKGVDRLIPAWAELQQRVAAGEVPACELRLIGSGPLHHDLVRAIASHGVGDSARLLGRLPPREVAAQLNQAHCLVLPSRSEGMPNVVMEALACGLPVVASAVSEVPFLVEPGRNGLLLAPDAVTPATLGAALAQALTREWDYDAIAAAHPPYTWAAAAQVLVDHFESQRPCIKPSTAG